MSPPGRIGPEGLFANRVRLVLHQGQKQHPGMHRSISGDFLKAALFLILGLILPGLLSAAQDYQQSMELMRNADFSDGTTHWRGDCRPVGSDVTTDFTSNSEANSKGIIVDLHSSSWTKITQEITNPERAWDGTTLTIVYQTSSDFKLSTRDSDYRHVGPALEFGGAGLPGFPGNLLAFLDVPPYTWASVASAGGLENVTANPDYVSIANFVPSTDGQQTFTAVLKGLFPNRDARLTFCLAFPPGSGRVTILKISLRPGSPQKPIEPLKSVPLNLHL